MLAIPQSTTRRVMLKLFLTGTTTAATGKTLAVTLSKAGAAFGNPSAGATNATELANGWYYVDLSTTDTATLGDLVVRGAATTCDDSERLLGVVKATNAGWTALPDAVAGANTGLPLGNASGHVTLADGVSHGGTLGSSTATLALSRLNVTSQTSNTAGVVVAGNGTGSGAAFTGGATGHGLSAVGGATSGDGANFAATTSGHGLTTSGAGTTKHGLNASGGATTSHGINATGGGVGHGILATSGSGTSASGIVCTSVALGGHGLSAAGNGSGSGILATGGNSAGSGIFGAGGSSSGVGGRFSGGSGGGDGITCTGVGTTGGHGFVATGSGVGKMGIVATGAAASGVNASGPGIQITGGAASTNSGGVSSPGMVVAGGAGAASVNGASSGATFTAGGTNTVATVANGITTTGASTGHGALFTSGAGATGDGIKAVSAATDGNGMTLLHSGSSVYDLNVTTSQLALPGTTTAAIAAAVWQDATAGDFTTANSIGKSLYNAFTSNTSVFTTAALANAPTGGAAPTAAAIATAVWTDTTAGDFTTALSVGKSVMNGVTLGTGLTVAAVSGAVGSVTGNVGGNVTGSVGSVAAGGIVTASFAAGATIPRVTLADTVTTYTGNTPQTGDSYARIGATGAGLTSLASAAGLATVAGYIDTEVASILAAVDTEVASIKAVTDNLATALVLDGSVYQFTANALELGPSGSGGGGDATLANQTTIIGHLTDIKGSGWTSSETVRSIGLKVANLPADPADASDIAGSFATVNSTLATIGGYLDTEVAAIKAVTDALPNAGALSTIQSDLDDLQAQLANVPTVAQILTTTMTESYAASGAGFSLAQALYELSANVSELAFVGTAGTFYGRDHVTPAGTITVDSATNPTLRKRAT